MYTFILKLMINTRCKHSFNNFYCDVNKPRPSGTSRDITIRSHVAYQMLRQTSFKTHGALTYRCIFCWNFDARKNCFI